MSNCTYVGPARRLPVLGMLCSDEEIRASEAFHSAFVFRCRSGRQRRSMRTYPPFTRPCAECGVDFTTTNDHPTRRRRFCSPECRRGHLGPKRTTWQERFWRHLEPGAIDACWEWKGMRSGQGYGKLATVGRGVIAAHRASYILANGPIGVGLSVCHRCDNPPCCNPSHLFLGTNEDNMRDMARKGRTGTRVGAANNKAKVSWQQVLEIRAARAAGIPVTTLAERYSISQATVSAIATYRTRKVA